MRIAFAALHFPSHLRVATTLARKVRERGHDVFFVGIPDSEAAVRASGLQFFPVAEQEFPVGACKERDARLAKLSGMAGFKFSLQSLSKAFDAVVRDCPDVLRRAGAEAAVIDQLGTGYSAAARTLGLPLINVAISLPGNPWESAPPPVLGWRYRPGWIGRIRNRAGHALVRHLTRPYLATIQKYYESHGLTYDISTPSFGCSELAQITHLPAAFDFPNPDLPAWFHHTGPFEDGGGREPASFPWERLTGEPMIYASMGTLQNGVERVFRMIAEACSGSGCQLVLSVGRNVDIDSIGPLPANCIALPYVPQREVLDRAALCICHAGLNTAFESLAAGVPIVAIPVTNDQPGAGARIEYTRTGVVVPFKKVSVARLRRAIRLVLDDPRYRANARRLQTAFATTNGLEQAAGIIEKSLAQAAGDRFAAAALAAR